MDAGNFRRQIGKPRVLRLTGSATIENKRIPDYAVASAEAEE